MLDRVGKLCYCISIAVAVYATLTLIDHACGGLAKGFWVLGGVFTGMAMLAITEEKENQDESIKRIR